ncbi:hypothetical protein MUNTM_28350 [Mycobacterium sp. MUNTM1]
MYWSSAGLKLHVAEASGADSTAPPSIEAPSATPAAHADDTRTRERVRVLVISNLPLRGNAAASGATQARNPANKLTGKAIRTAGD